MRYFLYAAEFSWTVTCVVAPELKKSRDRARAPHLVVSNAMEKWLTVPLVETGSFSEPAAWRSAMQSTLLVDMFACVDRIDVEGQNIISAGSFARPAITVHAL